MKIAHRYNWHYMREIYPDGDKIIKCDWCGASHTIYREINKRNKISDCEETGCEENNVQ